LLGAENPVVPASTNPLICIERRTASFPGAHGWRAHIAFVPEDGEPPEVVVYCPDC
jgi:hypothetical protein